MNRLLLGLLLCSAVHTTASAYQDTTDYRGFGPIFFGYGFGGRMGGIKGTISSAALPIKLQDTPGNWLAQNVNFNNAAFRSVVNDLHIGGDYTFSSTCLSLGLIGGYTFSGGHAFIGDPEVDYTTAVIRARGYTHIGARLGWRCQRALFFGKIGASFPSFSGTISAIDLKGNYLGDAKFKAKTKGFLCLGGGIDVNITRNFALGMSYNWHTGKAKLNKASKLNYNTTLLSAVNTSIDASRIRFSEVMLNIKYMLPLSGR